MNIKNKRTIALVESAIMIALASVLSIFQIVPLPYGGGFTICSMLPLIIIAYRHGLRWGLGASFTYSIIQMMLGMKTISAAFLPGDDQMVLYKAIMMVLLDYVFAYSVLGLAALTRKKGSASRRLCLGAITGCSLRYIMHIISGYILWGSYAEWFFSDEMQNGISTWILGSFSGNGLAFIYSLVYNGIYMIPEIILTAVASFFIAKIPQLAEQK